MEESRCVEILRKANLKITPKRKAIIKFFLQNGRYFTPEEVWTILKSDFKHLGLPTIYRNLKELEDIGILIRVSRSDQRLYYAICHLGKGKEHHHFVCQKCNRVSEVEFCNFKDIAEGIEKKLNCKITSHFTQIEGLCSECR
ncbi:MAG: Fur family transcriptional regulator [Candidatus Aerophobetes bacterium]|nr:Fur family transcriptional regulator [Candidatus Aerophobetes bacterium]